MRIGQYEVECTELELIALHYFMGDGSESVEQWVTRVFDACEEHRLNAGISADGRKMPAVYNCDPHELWRNKVERRKKILIKKLLNLDVETLSASEVEQALLDCAAHPDYLTQDARFAAEQAHVAALELQRTANIEAKIAALRLSNLQDATIEALYPAAKTILSHEDK